MHLHKKILHLFLIFCLSFGLTAWGKPKSIILFNNCPITKENLLQNSTEFTAGKHIYYIFITEKPLNTNIIRMRILKRDPKANCEPVNLVYSNDFLAPIESIYHFLARSPGSFPIKTCCFYEVFSREQQSLTLPVGRSNDQINAKTDPY